MKGTIKFQTANTNNNNHTIICNDHNPLQFSDEMGTEQGVRKGIKMDTNTYVFLGVRSVCA